MSAQDQHIGGRLLNRRISLPRSKAQRPEEGRPSSDKSGISGASDGVGEGIEPSLRYSRFNRPLDVRFRHLRA
jgi:hypothetical protein